MEDQRRRITKAKMSLMRWGDFALFSGVLAMGKITVTTDIPTACTDGFNEMYNPDFLATQNDNQVAFIVAHETLHKAWRHLSVYEALNKKDGNIANQAMDYWINLKLVEIDPNGDVIELPRLNGKVIALLNNQYQDMSVPEIFRVLYEAKQEQGEGGQGEQGEGEGNGFDEHDWEGAGKVSDEERKDRSREIEQGLRQGKIAQEKYAGKSSSGNPLDRALDELLNPKIRWEVLMREFLTKYVKGSDESTWSPVSRRSLAQGYYTPSSRSTSMGRVVTAPDVSASIGRELTIAMSEMKAIFEDVRPDTVDMMYWDTEVTSHETYETHEVRDIHTVTKPVGGGGTSSACVFEKIKEEKIEPDCILLFTDGYIHDWGVDTGVPTMWCVIGNKEAVAPFGKTIHMDLD
jgi:predicted metal-dependent peptidase